MESARTPLTEADALRIEYDLNRSLAASRAALRVARLRIRHWEAVAAEQLSLTLALRREMGQLGIKES